MQATNGGSACGPGARRPRSRSMPQREGPRGWQGPRQRLSFAGPSTSRLTPPPAGPARPPDSHSHRPNFSKLLSAWPDLLSGKGGARCRPGVRVSAQGFPAHLRKDAAFEVKGCEQDVKGQGADWAAASTKLKSWNRKECGGKSRRDSLFTVGMCGGALWNVTISDGKKRACSTQTP